MFECVGRKRILGVCEDRVCRAVVEGEFAEVGKGTQGTEQMVERFGSVAACEDDVAEVLSVLIGDIVPVFLAQCVLCFQGLSRKGRKVKSRDFENTIKEVHSLERCTDSSSPSTFYSILRELVDFSRSHKTLPP